MQVELKRIEAGQREVLRQLLQLYAHDFSEILGLEVGDDGRFAEPSLDSYWQDPRREPYFIRAGGKLAGFALVHRGSRLSSDADVWDMAEFFVLRRYRRTGVGTRAAHEVFAAHPGKWEVRQKRENVAALDFWRRAIGAYGDGKFREAELGDERWRGTVQSFDA